MANNKIKPIDALRREKQFLREDCASNEENLTLYWRYINHNLGSLLLHGAISGVRNRLGFGTKQKAIVRDNEDEVAGSGANGLFQGALGGLMAASPMIWELVQPMIMNFAIRKFKSIFTGKKKKDKKKEKKKEKKSDWW